MGETGLSKMPDLPESNRKVWTISVWSCGKSKVTWMAISFFLLYSALTPCRVLTRNMTSTVVLINTGATMV